MRNPVGSWRTAKIFKIKQGACLLVGADGVPEDVDGVSHHGNGAVLGVLVTDPVPAYCTVSG